MKREAGRKHRRSCDGVYLVIQNVADNDVLYLAGLDTSTLDDGLEHWTERERRAGG